MNFLLTVSVYKWISQHKGLKGRHVKSNHSWLWWTAVSPCLVHFPETWARCSFPQGHILPLSLIRWNEGNDRSPLPGTLCRPHNRCHMFASDWRLSLTGIIIIILVIVIYHVMSVDGKWLISLMRHTAAIDQQSGRLREIDMRSFIIVIVYYRLGVSLDYGRPPLVP